MRRIKGYLTITAILSMGLLSSCEEQQATQNQGNLKISTRMVRSSTAPMQTAAPMLVFNSGYVVVREVVFDGDMADGRTISITEELITTIDLVSGIANPPFLMDIPPGTYTSVNLGIEIQDETARPSVVAEGMFTNAAGIATPIRFEFNSGEVFEANSDEPVTLSAATPATAKITFDPHIWFSTITAAQLNNAARFNGVIVVSETRNTGIFNIVADRLDEATESDFR
ncbi:MAG TPA: hypothetical protein DCM62_03825 [Bacteroidales bacterium]|nr:hypothetical protein [Bacteroidales bacterium]